MVTIKRHEVQDLVVYLQKKYKLYFVEFRRAPNGKDAMVLCHHTNKDWWIEILYDLSGPFPFRSFNRFGKVHVFVANTQKSVIKESDLVTDIRNRKFKGYAKKNVFKWLKL